MPALFHMIVARIRAFVRRGDLDREFDQELAAHLAMAEEEKIRQGMTQEQARRAARIELGGVTQLREASREARGLPWLDTFWLDIKLGLRMLRKSWGLTLVGGLAMSVAIIIGVVVFTFFDLAYGGTLPLDEGDRVVALQTWDAKAQRRHETAMPDLERWRENLRSVESIGGFQTIERNLIIGERSQGSVSAHGLAEPVLIAEMTASGFQLARVPPLLGRTLLADDERSGAAPVVVIGYDTWQSRFAADPAALGQTIRLGDTLHTVVGVMPEGFAFPVSHGFWTPLPADRSDSLPAGLEGSVFARLAPGVTLEGAQAELTTLGLLPAVAGSQRAGAHQRARQTGEDLHARVVPYTSAFTGDDDPGQVRWMVRLILALVILLLVPPCANIAILVYARTITRQEELAARYALGASRGRIVGQLFVEILVLAAGAAAAALLVVGLSLRWAETNLVAGAGIPFWIDFSLSARTVLFAAGLAVVAATIAGLMPALKATGRRMQSGLHSLGKRTGMKLGATWSALVVAQVAISLAALPSAVEIGWGTIRQGILGPGFAAEDYLTAVLAMDRVPAGTAAVGNVAGGGAVDGDASPFASRFGALQTELVRQLQAEPGVLGVTVASLPGDEPWQRIEIEQVAPPPAAQRDMLPSRSLVRVNQVDDAFFEVFDMPLLSGRGFEAADFEPGRNAVIVNRTFADKVLGDGNPLGRRVRYFDATDEEASSASRSRTWYQIVGVVADRPANVDRGTMYRPVAAGQVHPASFALRLGPNPGSVADRLREITTSLDPSVRLNEIFALDEIYRGKRVGNNAGAVSLAAVTLSVLLLSAAGLYALMSFTINQRRREIGIRSALGARPLRLLASIFKRAAGQFAAGTACGVLVALLLDHFLPAEMVGGWNVPGIIPAAAAFMMVVGLLAAAGPARRGLRVEPIEELRQG